MNGPYDDIIDLPHHESKVHPRMSMYSRAAQFAPFSALTGHDAAIRETARLTDQMVQLTAEEAADLDRKLSYLLHPGNGSPAVTITYFMPDASKSGGAYRTVSGKISKADIQNRSLMMDEGTRIPLDAIMGISGECFE